MKTLVVLPSYNEAKVLAQTLSELSATTDADLLVVDDGSSDETCAIAAKARVRCVRHIVNLGLGAALETGFEAGRRGGYDVLVTFDADGQHNPMEVKKLIDALSDADVAIGVRSIGADQMPFVKKVGNSLLNILTSIVFGVSSSDSQSGLRAFNRKAIEAIKVVANRYEVSSEILFEAKRNGLRMVEVPVEAIYTDHSMSNGTGVMDGFKILWRMIIHER